MSQDLGVLGVHSVFQVGLFVMLVPVFVQLSLAQVFVQLSLEIHSFGIKSLHGFGLRGKMGCGFCTL